MVRRGWTPIALQDADRFHRDGAAGAVVGRAGAGMPRVEVAAEHHDLRSQHRIGAGDFGDDVEAVDVRP